MTEVLLQNPSGSQLSSRILISCIANDVFGEEIEANAPATANSIAVNGKITFVVFMVFFVLVK